MAYFPELNRVVAFLYNKIDFFKLLCVHVQLILSLRISIIQGGSKKVSCYHSTTANFF